MQHKFFIDRKQTVWERSHYTIEAESYEKAVERIKEIAINEDDIANEFDQCEIMYETAIPMTPEENDYCSTVEVFKDDGIKEVWDNGPDYNTELEMYGKSMEYTQSESN
jgi:hypothetical protein